MSKKKPKNKLKYHIKTKLQVVGLNEVSRRSLIGVTVVGGKKNVNRKKKILATKSSLRISCQDFHVSWYREVLDLLQVVRFFFVLTELLYLN